MTSGKMQYVSALLLTLLTVVLIGAIPSKSAPLETVELAGPYWDETTGALTVAVRVKPGFTRVRNAQNAIMQGLDMLSEADSRDYRKVLLITPGHYVFNRPVIYRQHHKGIHLVGEPALTRTLTQKTMAPATIRDEITHLRPGLPVIDGKGVTSFLVIDAVASDVHLNLEVTGFYFIDQMAGLGGSHYPDFSYRLEDDQFTKKGGYYTRYAYNDGGVVSVLGNSSVNFEHNIVDGATAFQCGGVLRNEQYGAPGSTEASIVAHNIVINPFAWHTGAFVDNNTGSYIKIISNQILIDRKIPHEVDMITNFDYAFMVAENNRIIDARRDKRIATVGIRTIGPQGGIISDANIFEGLSKPFYHNADGSPPFPENRDFYFLILKGKLLKLIRNLIFPDDLPLVRPGHWPDHMDDLVRTKDLDDNDPLRISTLKIHFGRYYQNTARGKG